MDTNPTHLFGYTDGAEVIDIDSADTPIIDVISHVVYSQIKSQRSIQQLRMTLLVPRTDAPKPTIVYFPGGGFTSAIHDKYLQMRMALAKQGFVVAAVEYRTIPAQFPAPVVDGKSAIRYLREHAHEYGIDVTRIGVLGDSAGGYVAQMVAMTADIQKWEQGQYLNHSSEVQAATTIYGISNLLNIGENLGNTIDQVHASVSVPEALLLHGIAYHSFPGATISSDPEKALNASPMGHLDGHKPPFLILHGSADPLVSPKQSEQLYKALKAHHQGADYWLVKGAKHGDAYWYQPQLINRVVQWFSDKLNKTPE